MAEARGPSIRVYLLRRRPRRVRSQGTLATPATVPPKMPRMSVPSGQDAPLPPPEALRNGPALLRPSLEDDHSAAYDLAAAERPVGVLGLVERVVARDQLPHPHLPRRASSKTAGRSVRVRA